jgi:hypothetical protein
LAAMFARLPVNGRCHKRVKAKPRGTLAKAPVRTQGPPPNVTAGQVNIELGGAEG